MIPMAAELKLKRVYEKTEVTDGERILVDRFWPRGIRRSSANIDIWMKGVAPSNELRKWFSHEQSRWEGFKKRYNKELENNKAFEKLIKFIKDNDTVTLLYSTKDTKHNNAVVLLEAIKKRLKEAENK
ncbi:DUF488 family protein [Candidatus Marsarchaeota archaeon]|nr:DUF488 family protein [Candidatus Marsarchaeota archaeon]MCL5089664.1 DUF488 family protein [Candidatus Marsarchaeota archaeon]